MCHVEHALVSVCIVVVVGVIGCLVVYFGYIFVPLRIFDSLVFLPSVEDWKRQRNSNVLTF